MAKDKKSFLLYCDLIHTVKKLPKEKQGELFMTILQYVNDMNPEIKDLNVDLVFEGVKQSLKRDLIKYEETCNKNRQNILKRWNKKDTTVYDRIPIDTKDTDSGTDTDTDTDNVSESVTQEQFLELFNRLRISKGLKSNIKRLGYEEMANLNLLDSYTIKEFEYAINNCLSNKWVIENNQGFPKHLLKLENFTKYLNMESGRKPISEMTTHEKLKLR